MCKVTFAPANRYITLVKLGMLLVSVLVPLGAQDLPIGDLRIRKSLAESDLVCKGEVRQVRDLAPSQSASFGYVAEVQPLTCVKGNPSTNLSVKFGPPRTQARTAEFLSSPTILRPGDVMMLFLVKDVGHSYVLPNPFGVKDSYVLSNRFGARMLVSKNTNYTSKDPITYLKTEFEQAALSSDPQEQVVAVAALSSIGDSTSIAVIKRVIATPNIRVKAAGYTALVQFGEYTILKEVDQGASDLKKGAPLQFVLLAGEISMIRDPRAVPGLMALLANSVPELKRSAIQALGRMKIKQTALPISKGLTDGDAEIRYVTVFALANIFDSSDYGPSVPRFEANEKKYLDYWKAKIAKEQAAGAEK